MTEPTAADHAWFTAEVSVLLPSLYGAAIRLCHDRTEAEDLVAETLTKAWQRLPSLVDRQAFRGWMLRILTNTYLSQYRAARNRPTVDPLGADAGDFSLFERVHQSILLWSGDPEQEFLDGLVRADLQAALDALPEVFRTVVVLVDIRGMSYRDVAEELGVPIGTVRSRLFRGRARLQRELWQYARTRPVCPPSPGGSNC
ncbi:sigma-70 family RNA polymerase sigma factor [Nocardioides sp.]|uniref:sigma-70 family RNA polymerase sigma factor n=1 Tax=Nocardioides sp. TaxID=35761 RepID=UPI0027362BC7|nr:sigma-70 family RNA polymerase sigma factor [Nocardioides sp.]MDP3892001.1 sigma-70 family RNA polymerase sigma factor [Nocardioides sp.]